MDFEFRYIYLFFGLLMCAGSAVIFFVLPRRRPESLEEVGGRAEFGFVFALIVLALGVMLLRLAWVMFAGPGRGTIF